MARHLVLKDGTVYSGEPLGADIETAGEVVFNTGMTGYQEILTDPSYAGQIVLLTYPLIGNYGVNDDDFESASVQSAGLIVGEAEDRPSNWRSQGTLHGFLQEHNKPGLHGVDTRAITKHLRSAGVVMGLLTDDEPSLAAQRLNALPDYGDRDFVELVSTPGPYAWGFEGREPIDSPAGGYKCKLAVLDLGLKYNILRRFSALKCRSVVLPQTSTADEILGWSPDGLVISPGPGDPKNLKHAIEVVHGLLGKVPIFGICLGNQMLSYAMGGKTYKLKFGHRGSNHPVKDLVTGRVTITSQNHGYAVDGESLAGTGAEIDQINLNDGTVEGLRHAGYRARSIQYHPEAAPGPWDSRPYFAEFIDEIGKAGS
ncbi:MAG: glutamine-hydrolyzing carbamoyl-phosphate synthase small subunit [Armatimonadota bacterium]|nr:glutamine-hydrolyzing carbamoyl-phosphate synthase small subunit [Armatimonadota bacterium]